jgi:predicted AAA+ superfamily ATPase
MINSKEYINRVTDGEVLKKLETLGGLIIVGPKWCGKTSTAEQFAKSAVYLDDEEDGENNVNVAMFNPHIMLDGQVPRLIDEWQLAPTLFDAARRIIDQRGASGQFIFTGSTTPPEEKTRHSGTGRFSRMEMFPMSLYETGDSNGAVSLASLFDGDVNVSKASTLTVEQLAFAIARGGWPGALRLSDQGKLNIANEYVESLVNSDFLRLRGKATRRKPEKLRALLRSYARNVATATSIETILADVTGSGITMSKGTAENYILDMKELFAINDQPAWNGNMRSRTPVRQTPKRHLADPSLAASLLGATPDKLLRDYNTFGFLFESLCVRDTRVYASPLEARVSHYRDKNGLEADIVIERKDGSWGAIEVKLGSQEEESAAKNLLAMRSKVDTSKSGRPAFLAILTGGKYTYRREDGVFVIPIGCFGP